MGEIDVPEPIWPMGPRSTVDPRLISLLERQILCLREFGVDDVGVVIGWWGAEVARVVGPLSVTLIENTHPDIEESGTAHSFQFAARSSWNPLDGREPLLRMDGDLAYERPVLGAILDGDGGSRLLVAPAVARDDEEVRVYADSRGPRLVGKGLGGERTRGLSLLGEATGMVRFEPCDHALVRDLVDGLVGDPGESTGGGASGIAAEHEELSQQWIECGRLEAPVLPEHLVFIEVDFPADLERLRSRVYPEIMRRDA